MTKKAFWRARPSVRLRAKQLRHTATEAEQMRFLGLKFRRQHPIGAFIVDFYCAEQKLVIELDGPVPEQHRERDRERDAWLRCCGYRVLRIKNAEIEEDLTRVLERLAAACRERNIQRE